MNYVPFVLGGAIIGMACWQGYTMSSRGASDFKDKGDTGCTAPTLSQYDDVGDDLANPMNFTTNHQYQKIHKVESGPFGVPRVIYTGPGGSLIPTFGFNYNKF